MTPDIIILGPTATVAEALAQIRDPDWLVSIAAQVFVVQPPYKPPTGHLPRRRPLPAAAARAAEHRAQPLPRARADDHARPPRARGRRTARQLQHARRRRLRPRRPPARRDHRRRRARPHAADRLAPAASCSCAGCSCGGCRHGTTIPMTRREDLSHAAPAAPARVSTTTPRRSAASANRSRARSAPLASSSSRR